MTWEQIDEDDPKLKAINKAINIVQEADYKITHLVLTPDGHVIDLRNMREEEYEIVRRIIEGVTDNQG